MNANVAATDKKVIDQLVDMLVKSHVAMEVFSQIFAEATEGKSAYDITIMSPSGKQLAYSSVHRWIKILSKAGAIETARQVKSKKKGLKILYTHTMRGEKAYYFAVDYINRRNKAAQDLLKRAKESGQFAGFGAPDLLKAALELAKKGSKSS